MSESLTSMPTLSGRIVEVGRCVTASKGMSEAVIDVGQGQLITLAGFSDTVAKWFASNLYKHVTLEVTAHDE